MSSPEGYQPPKQGPRPIDPVTLRNRATCGGPLSRGQHVNCPQCWESLPGHDFSTRSNTGKAISKSRGDSRAWREAHPSERGDPKWYQESVLPGLQNVPLSRIMGACGVAKSTASAIRSGKQVPAERHWETLDRLSRPSPLVGENGHGTRDTTLP
jgi:hypothetical protein